MPARRSPRRAGPGPALIRAGFDEAGLGPTLGPLVVAGFVTRRADPGGDWGPCDDLSEALAELVGPPGRKGGRIEVGDSKKIHVGARKLARIERTALATVAWMHGRVPASVAELLELVAPPSFESPGDRRAPWWASLDEALPIAAERAELEQLGQALATRAAARGIEPLWYRADVISAARINRELAVEEAREGTKNTWATHAVLRLTKLAVDELGARARAEAGVLEAMTIWCDKAGGRAAYSEPLRRAYPQLGPPSPGLFGSPLAGLETIAEQRERSHYRLLGHPPAGAGAGSRSRLELGFVMGGDRCDVRISWASILAKYLRELIMRSFNRHFAARVPELRPTAGYPEDAQRFIAEVAAALGRGGGLERAAWIRAK